MAAKDSFDAFVSILRDKINGFSEDANEPNRSEEHTSELQSR